MLFRVDSWESQLNSYRKSITNNNNINNLHTKVNYLITDIEIDLINNDEVKEKNDELNMKADDSIETIQRSNTKVVYQNNSQIRNFDENEEKKEYQDVDDNTCKHSDESLNHKITDFHYRERTDSFDTTRASNFFSIFFNFM